MFVKHFTLRLSDARAETQSKIQIQIQIHIGKAGPSQVVEKWMEREDNRPQLAITAVVKDERHYYY